MTESERESLRRFVRGDLGQWPTGKCDRCGKVLEIATTDLGVFCRGCVAALWPGK